MSMYKKYFLKKRQFWVIPKKNNTAPCYMFHDPHAGGVYAYVMDRGVMLKTTAESKFFNNFNELDQYLDLLFQNSRKQPVYGNPKLFFEKTEDPTLELERIPL